MAWLKLLQTLLSIYFENDKISNFLCNVRNLVSWRYTVIRCKKKNFLTKRMCFLFIFSSFSYHKIDNSNARASIKVNNIQRPALITVIAGSWTEEERERERGKERKRERENLSIDHGKYKWSMRIPYIEWFDYCLNYSSLDATSTMSRSYVQFWLQSFIRLIHLLENLSIYAVLSFFFTFQ